MDTLYAAEYLIKMFKFDKYSKLIISLMLTVLLNISFQAYFNKLYAHFSSDSAMYSVLVLVLFVMITVTFIVADAITGIIASRHEGSRIQSSKIGATIGKLFGVTLYAGLSMVMLVLLPGNYIVTTMVYGPILLTALKEFISIGENLERRFDRKIYLFQIIDKIFDLIELKFFKFLEKKASKELDKGVEKCETPSKKG